ncbi:MAG: ClpX C4-type zinc finger protein [Myxococcota bacterium]
MDRRRFIAGASTSLAAFLAPSNAIAMGRPVLRIVITGTCSFGGKSAREVQVLVGTPLGDTTICDECIRLAHQIALERLTSRLTRPPTPRVGRTGSGSRIRCSFCDTCQYDAQLLVAGPGIYICEVCIEQAHGFVR